MQRDVIHTRIDVNFARTIDICPHPTQVAHGGTHQIIGNQVYNCVRRRMLVGAYEGRLERVLMYEVHSCGWRDHVPDGCILATQQPSAAPPHLIEAVVLAAVFSCLRIANDDGWPKDQVWNSTLG